jgi:two-component system cell cycle sensor histidine kinase/response regulator CckA
MANILVIDDESLVLDLISATLRRDGHNVTAMADPLAAIDAFINGRLAIDLLLTDVSMSPISGFEIFKRMLSAGFDGPVLFMSGYSALSGAIVGSLGERAIIEKPFTAAELRAAVGRAVAKIKAKPPCAA